MTTPRYIIDREEFGCGQTVTRAEDVSTIVEICPWCGGASPETHPCPTMGGNPTFHCPSCKRWWS